MGDNISKFYNAFSKKYDNFKSEDEFRNYLKGAKRENIDKLFKAFSSKYDNFGSSDDMSSYLGWSEGQGQTQQAPAVKGTPAPVQVQPTEQPAQETPRAGQFMYNPAPQPESPYRQPVKDASAPSAKPEPSEPTNPFPYRKEDSFEEELNTQLADLKAQKREIDNSRGGDDQLIKEYESRLKELHNSLDPTSKKHRENEQWLREHKAAYTAARDSDKKKESDRLTGEISKIENAQAAAENQAARKANRQLMESPQEVIATGKTAFGRDNAGRNDKEYSYRRAAEELYAQAEQEYRRPNKYDENAGSFVDQFAEGAGNNIDRGSLTMGLSEGAASVTAREIGDHYDEVVTSALKDMGVTDADITADMVTMETSGKRLEKLNEEAGRMGAELEAMKSTYEDMARRGDPRAEAYGRQLNQKIDEYNKWLEKDYKPVRESYDTAKERYDKVMGAIDDRVSGELSDGEMAVLDALEKLTKAKMLRSDDVSVAAKAGAGAEQSAEFMLDFYLTGGLSKAGTRAATKLTTKHLLRKFGKDAVKDMAAKGTINPTMWSRIATDAAVSAARTSLMATRNLQTYGENLTEYVGRDSAGRFNFDRSHLNAALNTALTQYIEYWSEGFGEYFGAAEQALFKNVTKTAPRAAIGQTLKGYRGSIGQYLDKGKFDGMFNEMLEEVVGSTFNSLAGWMSGDRVGDEGALKDFFAGENLATLALSFLPMSAISTATNLGAYHEMKRRYDAGVAGLKPFIESGAISQEELQHLSLNLTEMTPQEITKKMENIADRARKANGGRLPQDFAQNLLGYLEGDFAMSLRNDEWGDSQEKMAIVNAYTSNYSNPNASNAWDYDQNLKAATEEAVGAGFTEEELEKDSYMIGQDAMELRVEDPGRADVLMDYATAKAAVEGLQKGYYAQTRQIDEARDAAVRRNLDVNGDVIAATLGGQRVFVLSEDVTLNPDGTISTPTGDGLVAYRESEEDEEPKTAKAGEFSEAASQTTDSFVAEVNDFFDRQRAAVYEKAQKTVSPMGQIRDVSQRVGQQVVVSDQNGLYVPVTIERMTEGGAKAVIKGDKAQMKDIATVMGIQEPAGQYLEAEVARLYPLLDKQEDGSLTTFQDTDEQEEQIKKAEQAAQASENGTQLPEIKQNTWHTIDIDGKPTDVRVFDVGPDGVKFEYDDAEGNSTDGRMSMYEFQNALKRAQEPAPAAVQEEVPAAPAAQEPELVPERGTIPVNEETGEKIYDHPSVTPEAAFQEIMGNSKPGSKDEANRLKAIDRARASAHQDVNIAEAAIEKAKRDRIMVDEWELPDDESLDAFEQRKERARVDADARLAELERQLPELQRRAEHWDAVQELAAQRAQQAKAEEDKKRLRKLTNRAKKWEKLTGVKVNILNTPEEVKKVSDAAAKDLKKGDKVYGWYNKRSGEVYIYAPSFGDDLSELDKTYIHEVVAHKGLPGLLGEDGYNELCDRVWNELMTPEDRKMWMAYNSHLTSKNSTLQARHRAAADEFIADISEHLNEGENKSLFDKIVEWVKEILDRLMSSADIEAEAGEKVAAAESISTDLLKELLADSMARFVSQARARDTRKMNTDSLPAELQKEMADKGLVMEGGAVMDDQQAELKRVTGYKTPNELDEESNSVVGDIRFSKSTVPAWEKSYLAYPDAKEHVVKVIENVTDRLAADELVYGVVPHGTYKYGEKSSGSFAGPLRTNIEYIVTFDMDTSCPRSLQYLEYVKKIESQIGRPLTQRESIQLIEMMRMYGQMIPCVYCYCENKRQALKQYFTDFMEARHAVVAAKTDAEALEHMYGHATGKDAEGSKDPAVALTKAAYKVFQQWRSEKEYNPTMRQLWAQYKNDRNVILTALDNLLDNGTLSTMMTDEQIAKAVCDELKITDKAAQGAVGDIVSEWKWNRIEDVPHDDFTRIQDEDDMVIDQRTLNLWREMTLYGKSASSAKNVLRYVPYTDELKTLSQEQKDFINGMAGLRMHSSNDFRIDYFLDYLQFMADMEVNGMMGHTYTKSPEFVRIFGNSGYKINMSIAAYEDSHGIRPNADEGFDWTTARELREKFPNAGVMMMATSDNQVQFILDTDWIDMGIPFHHSGLPKEVWYNMRHWSDFTSKQNEKFLNGDEMRQALQADGVDVPKGAKAAEVEKLYNEHFNIRVEHYQTGKDKGKRIKPHFLPGPTVVDGVLIPGHNNDYQTYIDLCREWGVHPRFYGLRVKDNTLSGGGREVDITEHPEYMKFIKETARTDTPQTPIHFNFDEPSEGLDGMTPIDYAMRELEARAHAESEMAGGPVRSIYESYKQDPYGIVPQFINTIIKHKEETGEDYPLDYLTPDSRKWFMTERKALEDAYKDFDTIPYHPHEYDAEGNLIMTDDNGTPEAEVAENGEWESFRKVTSPAKITELEKGPKVKVYRSMQFVPDPSGDVEYDLGDGNGLQKGFLYAPMSAKVDGKWREPITLNRWEEAEENPDMADENGDFILDKGDGSGPMKVAYAPYLHTRRSPLNEQFSSAYKRPNLVIVESEVPESELTSGYTADRSKKSTGEHDWSSGKVSNALAKRGLDTRKVILSRWAKPVRVVPNSEVADEIVKLMGDRKLTFPYNVVTPSLRAELTKRGVKFNGWQGNKPKDVDELIAAMRGDSVESANTKQKMPVREEIDQTASIIEEPDIMFRLSRNNRSTVESWLKKRTDITDEERESVVNYIDNLDNAKLQLAAARWYANGAIRLPEDMDKVKQAVSVSEKAKVDPLMYPSPMALLDAHADFKPTEERINPDDVSTLHKAAEYPADGITVYNVENTEESRRNMREIINTHFGKDASPWCLLQGDKDGNLTKDSKKYWNHYNAYPKQVAFKDGKLLAFSANNKQTKLWWDRQDTSHYGIPVTKKIDGDPLGRSTHYMISEEHGGLDVEPGAHLFKGNRQNGLYEEWYTDGMQMIERVEYKDGKENGISESWFPNGQQCKKALMKDDYYVEADYWYDNGNPRASLRFDPDSYLPTGKRTMWWRNGNLEEESTLKDGHYVGERRNYYEDGTLRKVSRFDEYGDLIEEKEEEGEDIRFSKAIDRINEMPDDQPVLSEEEKSEIEKTNEEFNEKLANTTEDNVGNQKYSLGNPASILRDAGVANKEMILYGSKLEAKAKLHGFDYQDIKDLPEKINDPIAVFNNHEKDGNRSILTDLTVGDNNMLVAVNVGKKNDVDFNIIATITGKSGDGVVNWLDRGLDTYVNKEKALDYLLRNAPIASSTNNSELSSGSKVSDNSETSKENEENFRNGTPIREDIQLRKAEFEREKEELDNIRFRTTYHGTGADFEKFDHSHMGEGEGAQIYGWGTYVTTNRDTGIEYAHNLGGNTLPLERELAKTKEEMETANKGDKWLYEERIKDIEAQIEEMKGKRHLYTVEIPDDNGENYIHWEEPITEDQAIKITNAVRELADKEAWGDYFEDELMSALGPGTYGRYVEGGMDYFLGNERNYATDENPGAKRNAKILSDLGIVGIEIPIDLRGGREYEGSNYVIFNEDDLDIVDHERFRKDADLEQKEDRVAAAEREYTNKTLDAMTPAIGSGVRRVSRNDMPRGHKSDKGFYDLATNNVMVCMDNVTDERDAIATVLHETVGYKGLQELFGDVYRDTMARVFGALDNAGLTWMNGYIRRNNLQPGDDAIVRGMAQYMAMVAERDGGSALENVNEVLGEVIDDIFGTDGFRFTDRELAYMLRASYEHMLNPEWLDTPVGRAKDTLMKRELGINESDPNKPTDPDGPGTGERYRKGDTGVANADYNREVVKKMTALITENQNADLPVKIGIEKVMNEVKMERLAEDEDYLTRHNLSSSRAETETHDFELFHFNPLKDYVKELQKKLMGGRRHRSGLEQAYQRILDYMYAKSALERNEYKRNETGEQRDFSGITSLMGHPKDEWQEAEAEARAMVDAFENEVGKDMTDELWKRVQSCTDFSLDHARKYGLITDAEYERLHGSDTKPRMWNYYLPLRGFAERTAEDEYSYAGLMGRDNFSDSDVIMMAKGRWTEADNPIANILNIAQREIVQGNENWARQALYNFAVRAGKNSLLSVKKPWYEKVGKKWRLAVPAEDQSIEEFEAEMKEKKERGEARQGRAGAKNTPDNELKLDKILASKAHANQHLIRLKVGGEDRMIWVNGNPAMARAVTGYGRKPGWELTRAASRVISNMFTTYSLDFTAKNLIRDSIYSRLALLMKEDGKYRWDFFNNWWKNFGYGAFAFPMIRLAAEWESGKLQQKEHPTEKEQLFIDFMHDGGKTGYTVLNNVKQIKRELEVELGGAKRSWLKMLNAREIPIVKYYAMAVGTLNEAFELLTRFTAYQTSRQNGRSGQRAAFDAKEISVNFNRRGAQSGEGVFGNVAAYLGATHYFYNAGVQGFDNFLRLFKANKIGMSAATVGLVGLGILTPLLNSLFAGAGDGDDDKWYWNLPEWVRRNNIILGWGGTYVALPLPVEFRAFYGLGDIAASGLAYHKYPNPTAGRILMDVVSTASGILPVNPIEDISGSNNIADAGLRAIVPDVTMFFVDWATNHDYTGRPLVKENQFQPNMPKSQAYYASTPLALVKACQAVGTVTGWDIAPGVARDFMNNYLGGFYKVAEDISKQMFTDDEHPRRWDDIPFLSGFTGHIDEDRTDTYVKNVLNAYRDLSNGIVKEVNVRLNTKDVTDKMVYDNPEQVIGMAQSSLQRSFVERLLTGERYELAKTYYKGTQNEGTGEFHTVVKTYKSGKNVGKHYKRKEEIKILGTDALRRQWSDKKKEWAAMPEETPEQRSAKADTLSSVQNLWHRYCDANASLAEKLMNQEYGK